MMPVDEGKISRGAQPAMLAAMAHMRRASRRPWRPVQALALPLLTTMPHRRDLVAARFARPTVTPGETTRLVVNAAAALAGDSQINRPTSGACFDLIPA